MKYFITLCAACLLFVSTALFTAESGIFYNPDRDGEGITFFADGEQAVLFFYTYCDDNYVIPPPVSPAPPPIDELECANQPVWFVGQASNFDGESASGQLFLSEAVEYPFAVEDRVGLIEVVGNFVLERNGAGWELTVEFVYNPFLPKEASLYAVPFNFSSPLLQIKD